jgi:DNA primase
MAWRSLIEGRDLSTPERQAGLEKDIDELVNAITDRSVQSHYRRALRERFWTLLRGDRAQGSQGSQRRGSDWKPGRSQGQGNRGNWSGKGGGAGFRSRGGPLPAPSSPPPPPTNARILRERLLLAAAITHPEVFDHIGERLGSMDMSDPTLDSARQEVVIILSSEKNLDISSLRDQLSARGLAGAIAGLLRPDVLIHAKFARPGADPGLVKAGWDHTYDIHQRDALRADCRRANDRLGDHMTQEALEHFFAFKRHDTWSDAALPDDASFEGTVETVEAVPEFESTAEDVPKFESVAEAGWNAIEEREPPKEGGSR